MYNKKIEKKGDSYMAKMNYRKKSFGIIMFLMMLILLGRRVHATEYPATGLEVMDEKDFHKFVNSLPEIKNVYLNEEGIRAIHDYQKENNLEIQKLESVEKGNEIEDGEETIEIQTLETDERPWLFPTEHDVSKSNTFPPIGNQGSSGSCTSWSMGYYQMTNNLANIRGLNAKDNLKYRISPAWLHNLAKGTDGVNVGAALSTAAIIMLKQGVPYWTEFDGITTDKNYSSWNPDPVVWEKALSNRMEKCEKLSVSKIDEKTGKPDLYNLKKLLLNGYVVSFASYFKGDMFSENESLRGWEMSNTSILDSDKKGQWVMLAMYKYSQKELDADTSKKNSGHAMTIVGWDDRIELDYNNDGVADTKGALKIANSWGTNWHNNGFYWMAYDALQENSTLNQNTDRVPAIDDGVVFYLEPRKSYTPLLLAEVTIDTNSRRELALSFGISSNETTSANISTHALESYTLENLSEEKVPFWNKNFKRCTVNYDFWGKELSASQKSSATFTLDLTDLLYLYQQYLQSKNKNLQDEFQKFRLYFNVSDAEADGYGSTLNKIVLKDKISGKEISKTINLVVDGNEKKTYIDYNMDTRIVDKDKQFLLTFNYPIQQTSIDKDITITDYKSDNKVTLLPDITATSDRKKITLAPINNGYETGHYYSLNINVKSDGGNSLSNKNKYYFYRLKEAS